MRLWSSRDLSPRVTSWEEYSLASSSREMEFSIMAKSSRFRYISWSKRSISGSMSSIRAVYFWSNTSDRVDSRASLPGK